MQTKPPTAAILCLRSHRTGSETEGPVSVLSLPRSTFVSVATLSSIRYYFFLPAMALVVFRLKTTHITRGETGGINKSIYFCSADVAILPNSLLELQWLCIRLIRSGHDWINGNVWWAYKWLNGETPSVAWWGCTDVKSNTWIKTCSVCYMRFFSERRLACWARLQATF